MPTLNLNNFNIVCSVLGGFISLFGLISYLAKEKFYLSEACAPIPPCKHGLLTNLTRTVISLLAGVIFGPAANWIRPKDYSLQDAINLDNINLYFCRIVLGVQLVIAGIQLPAKYFKKEWKSLAYLLGPGMTVMWLMTSLLIWAMVPHLTFLYALAVGACVTPTDPILSNSILKGKFADKHIPVPLQRIVIAESGANDGLGYPFLFLPLYLITYIGQGAHGHTAGKAIGMWFYETWCYQIFLSCAYGLVCGWVARKLLQWAEERNYVDREGFIVFALSLAVSISPSLKSGNANMGSFSLLELMASWGAMMCWLASWPGMHLHGMTGFAFKPRTTLSNRQSICFLTLPCSYGLVLCVHGISSPITASSRYIDLFCWESLSFSSDVPLLLLYFIFEYIRLSNGGRPQLLASLAQLVSALSSTSTSVKSTCASLCWTKTATSVKMLQSSARS